jgi:hypothetical protein
LTADSSGNIALADPDLSVAQDVACSILLFKGELYYDTTQGVPYYQTVFKQNYSGSLISNILRQIALQTTNVADAQVNITNFDYTTRKLTGKILITTNSGVSLNVNI